ncbi:MAG: hypothetical protein IT583_06395 [Verrucomicrobia bacterium]|nr:hypothetical protein [Verrucomicrobiota bacterium]
MNLGEKTLVRNLAKRYMDIATDGIQAVRRDLWRKHNSFEFSRPLVYVRAFAWLEMPESRTECTDPLCKAMETFFKKELFRSNFGDDCIIEPWYTLPAIHKCSGWGVELKCHFAGKLETLESFKIDYFLKTLEDMDALRAPFHEIDEEQTALLVEKATDLIGDIMPIDVARGPAYWGAYADISTSLGHLRGIENIMMDMYESPEELHRLLKFMSDGVLRTHDQAEAAGDIGSTSSYNQAMPYAKELLDPQPNVNGIKRKQLWNFTAAQEFTLVSPEMHDEFMLHYQMPIMSKFGLVSYGCCEDLTNKIGMLRKIPNLRRIAVSPFADVKKCAERIGRDYVISYRPNPALLAAGYNKENVRQSLRRDFEVLKDTVFDVTLKDIETVEKDTTRISEWVKLTREVIAEFY